MKGRKPKPNAIRELDGTLEKKHEAKNIVRPRGLKKMPPAPRGYCKKATKVWRGLGELLREEGLLTVLDLPAFEIFCDSFDRYTRAKEELGAELIEHTQHGTKQKSMLVVIQRELAEIGRGFDRFGLSPVAREKITSKDPGKAEELAEILTLVQNVG